MSEPKTKTPGQVAEDAYGNVFADGTDPTPAFEAAAQAVIQDYRRRVLDEEERIYAAKPFTHDEALAEAFERITQ